MAHTRRPARNPNANGFATPIFSVLFFLSFFDQPLCASARAHAFDKRLASRKAACSRASAFCPPHLLATLASPRSKSKRGDPIKLCSRIRGPGAGGEPQPRLQDAGADPAL